MIRLVGPIIGLVSAVVFAGAVVRERRKFGPDGRKFGPLSLVAGIAVLTVMIGWAWTHEDYDFPGTFGPCAFATLVFTIAAERRKARSGSAKSGPDERLNRDY